MAGRYFSRWYSTRHREPEQRSQCLGCAGGGTVNGCWCTMCDGRGWFDASNPPPPEQKAKVSKR